LPPVTMDVLRSEIPSSMCAKLRTVAASNNRVHPTRSLYYCLFAPHTRGVFLHAHSVRGEPRIHNASGVVATDVTEIFPGFCLRNHRADSCYWLLRPRARLAKLASRHYHCFLE